MAKRGERRNVRVRYQYEGGNSGTHVMDRLTDVGYWVERNLEVGVRIHGRACTYTVSTVDPASGVRREVLTRTITPEEQ